MEREQPARVRRVRRNLLQVLSDAIRARRTVRELDSREKNPDPVPYRRPERKREKLFPLF
jgi:hypothetical protein